MGKGFVINGTTMQTVINATERLLTLGSINLGWRDINKVFLRDGETVIAFGSGTDSLNRPVPMEGTQMRKLRQDHWRMLGNGYYTRPDGVPCEYETICESCPCFSTTVEFLPILNKQKRDAEDKGQIQRADVFARLIQSMEKTPTRATTTPS